MLFKNTLCPMIYNAFYFMILFQQLHASNLNGTENIEAALNGIINDAERFDKSIDDLEYTVMHLEDSVAELQNVVDSPFVFFNDNKSDDVITVIEIKCNSKDEANLKDHMPGIVKCLKEYVSNDDEKEHFNEHAAIRVDTIRNEDLYRYELLYGSTSMYKDFRDSIQYTFIALINAKIENGLYRCFDHHIEEIVTQFVHDNNAGKITDDDYRRIKGITLQESSIRSFFTHCFDSINTELLENMNRGCDGGAVVYIKYKILRYKDEYDVDYVDNENLIDVVRKIYKNEFQDLMRNNMIIGIEKMIDAFKNMSIEDFRKICRKHVTSALRDKSSNVDSSNAPETSQVDRTMQVLENSVTSDFLFNDDAALVGKIKYECLREFREIDDTNGLYGVTSYAYTKSLKIVCSEKITEENLQLLCYILNNTAVNLKKYIKQVFYINMQQNVDLGTISKQIQNLFEYRDDGFIICGTKNENNEFERINIVSKKQGERKLLVSNIGIDSLIDTVNIKDYQDNEDKEAAATVIKNLIEQKTVEMNLVDNKRILMSGKCVKNKGCTSIYYKNSCSEFENIIKIDLRDIVSTDNVQVDIYKKTIRIEGAHLCPNSTDSDCLNSHDGYRLIKSVTSNARYIAPKLIQYLESLQLLPQGMEHTPLFNFGESQRYQVNDFTLCDTIIAPGIPITEVTSTIIDIEQKIESFYRSNTNTDKIIKIETSLFDFLKRNYSTSWRDSIQNLSILLEVDLEMFEKIIDKHLVDRYRINANKDYAIPSILSRDHKVVIIAVIRKNSNTILHLVRKDLEPIMSNLPLAKQLDFYTGNSTDIYNYYEDDYLDPISFTDNFEINTTAYVIQTMAALKFNMANDFVEQFKRRKHAFIEKFYKLISRHFDESFPIDTSFVSAPFTNGRHIRLHRTCFTVVFEERILRVLQYMEQKKREIKFNPSIRITVTTLQAPNTSDVHDVEDMIEKLRLD